MGVNSWGFALLDCEITQPGKALDKAKRSKKIGNWRTFHSRNMYCVISYFKVVWKNIKIKRLRYI